MLIITGELMSPWRTPLDARNFLPKYPDCLSTIVSIENNITTGNIKGDVGGDEVKSLNINVPPKKVSWADVVIGKQ